MRTTPQELLAKLRAASDATWGKDYAARRDAFIGIGMYERRKHQWINDHPQASAAEYEAAMRAIAKACGV